MKVISKEILDTELFADRAKKIKVIENKFNPGLIEGFAEMTEKQKNEAFQNWQKQNLLTVRKKLLLIIDTPLPSDKGQPFYTREKSKIINKIYEALDQSDDAYFEEAEFKFLKEHFDKIPIAQKSIFDALAAAIDNAQNFSPSKDKGSKENKETETKE